MQAPNHALGMTDGANRWTGCFDHVHGMQRAHLGLKEEDIAPIFHIMPWVGRGMWGIEKVDPKVVEKKVGRLFKDYAEISLPFFASLGFKRFFCGPHWRSDTTEKHGSNGGDECCTHAFEIGPQYGGEPAMKTLCGAANALGVQVFEWISLHLSARSELLRRNRDWKIRHIDGDEFPGGNLLGPMNLNSSFPRYVVHALRKVRRETGLNGVMFDTYHTEGGVYPVNYADPLLRPQAEEVFKLQARLQKLGLVNTIEGVGPFGVSTWGLCTNAEGVHHNLLQDYFDRNAFAAYKTSFGGSFDSIANGVLTSDQYCRLAANKCLMCLGVNTVIWKFDAKKTNREVGTVFTEPFQQANHDYNAVSKWMHRRTLLEKDRGVEWSSKDGKTAVLFSFADSRHALPRSAAVRDLTAGKELAAADAIAAKKNHTYLICWRTR